MKRFKFILIIAISLAFNSCKELERGALVNDGVSPQPLQNVTVKNLPGSVMLNYTLPNDESVLYVLAEFTNKKGEVKIEKSSSFKNSMLLEGFIRTDEQTINLYTVSRSEKKSEPTQVTIKPLRAPIIDAFNTLKAEAAFGGAFIEFENEIGNEYVLNTLIEDSVGAWENFDRLYTSQKEVKHSVYGLDEVPTDFAFYLLDKWENSSDTLYRTLTPLYEEQLNKEEWRTKPLDNDTYISRWANRPLSNLWDGSNTTGWQAELTEIHNDQLPNWFTIDLGVPALLSRIRVNHYAPTTADPDIWLFARDATRKFRVWGWSEDKGAPHQDGRWDDWELLGEFELTKPSGSPVAGVQSDEDRSVGMRGQDFALLFNGVSYRYFRFETITTYPGGIQTVLGELTVWGQPQ